MAPRVLPPFNAAWLAIDTPHTPMHVAGLYIFNKPADAGPDYLRSLVNDLMRNRDLHAPWNQKLMRPLGSQAVPVLVDDEKADVEYHVRYSALPEPGGERELGELVSRLHSHPLDMDRPLWECHVIGGLYDDRFAIYVKLHQALAYGPYGINALLDTLSSDPYQRGLSPVWGSGYDDEGGAAIAAALPNMAAAWGRGLASAATSLTGQLTFDSLRRAYSRSAPKSMLTGRVGGRRRVATQSYAQDRIDTLAAKAGADHATIVQYLTSSALRRFLKEYNSLPDLSLIAGVVVNIDQGEEKMPGAAIGLVKIGTNKADPLERLEKIKAGNERARARVAGMSPQAAALYSMSLMQPYLIGSMARNITALAPVRIPWNLFISAYEGPAGPLYFNGAPLENYYPLPPLWQGSGLAISGLAANGRLALSVVGDRDRVPHTQRLAVYMEDALRDLEACFAIEAEGEAAE